MIFSVDRANRGLVLVAIVLKSEDGGCGTMCACVFTRD